MKLTDFFKIVVFIVILIVGVLFAALITERYEVVHIQKQLIQYDREIKKDEVRIKKKQLEIKEKEIELQNLRFEAWLKAYSNGDYINEGEIN